MPHQLAERNKTITSLLNGTNKALKQVIPMAYTTSGPSLVKDAVQAQFGVLIGVTGDFKGKLVLAGDMRTFGTIGEKMFGMEVSEDMLVSFSGELGNMIAGNISTNIANDGVMVDITSPSIIEGQVKISGFTLAIQVAVTFPDLGVFSIYLIID